MRNLAPTTPLFASIERDFHQIENIRKQLDRLTVVKWEKPDPKPFDTVTTAGGEKWNAYGTWLS
jgi:hypothetical protein